METNLKDFLLKKLMDDPHHVSDIYFDKLLADETLTFADIRHCILRIFDINEDIFLEESDANNFLNRRTYKKRSSRFYKRFRNNNHVENGKVIVAEGDSWFQFPVFLKDIIRHLSDNPRYAIYSLAYGGDWLTNIIYEGRYVEKISVFNPDVFLVSGGGNDLVGADRLGIMVNAKGDCPSRYEKREELTNQVDLAYGSLSPHAITDQDKDIFMAIQSYIRPSFYAFLHIMRLQYALMFKGIHTKFRDMKILTQAYDYAIPSPDFHGGVLSVQYWVNRFLGTGRWMYIPMTINGIQDRKVQQQIIRYMIFHFNLMFARIATTSENVFHIDCRGVAEKPGHWYDELHLKSERFGVIARAYEKCIESTDASTKIYFANPKSTARQAPFNTSVHANPSF